MNNLGKQFIRRMPNYESPVTNNDFFMQGHQLDADQLLVRELGLSEGMVYADLGIGTAAYFVIQAGKIVGEGGIVYGVDILKQALESAESQAKHHNVHNLKTIWSDLEVYGAAKGIGNESLDRISLINLLHQTDQDEHVFNEANRMLKPGGRALIVDWLPVDAPHGPAMEKRTSLDKVRQMAKVVGWQESHSFEPSKFHFGIVFTK